MRPVALLALLPLALAAPVIAQQSDSKSTSASAQTSSSSDQTSADQGKAAKPKEEKKICHREIVTGSISPHFVCKTQSQIDAEKRASDESFDRTTQMSRVPGVTR